MRRFIRLFNIANSLERSWAPTQFDAPDTVILHMPTDFMDLPRYESRPAELRDHAALARRN